jgi:hypothetical protein
MLIDRIYPALSKHEIGTSEDRELVVRWQSEIEGAAKELDCRNSTASSKSRKSATPRGRIVMHAGAR